MRQISARGSSPLLAALMAVAMLTASCEATISFEQLSPELSQLEPLPVALSEDLKSLKEFNRKQGNPTTYEIGKLLNHLFVAANETRASLGSVNSRLEVHSYTDLLVFTKWEATYRLAVMLQMDGTSRIVSGVGTGSRDDTFTAARTAATKAMEECALDLYTQIQALIAQTPDVAPALPTASGK